MAISAKMRKFALTNPRYMKRILYFLMLIGLCACSGSKTILPNSVYNVKLGETYTESQMIDALNKDTFRSFRVYHKGDSFMPGQHDTFYRTERDGIIYYTASKAYYLPEFPFLDCYWVRFTINTNTSGKLIAFSFVKGTFMENTPISNIKAEYETLCARFRRLCGTSEDTEEDGKVRNTWKDSVSSLTVEYWEYSDYNNEPCASLSCKVSLLDDHQ